MQVTIIGNVCIDKNTSEKAAYTAAGGPAVFMDKVYSQIPDLTTTIVSPYGADFLEIAPHLPLFPQTSTSTQTLVYENVSEKGTRTQKAYHRELAEPIAITEKLQQILGTSDILFFTPLLPNISPEYVKHTTSFAKKGCVTALLPQGYYRQFTENNGVIHRNFRESSHLLPLVDIVIVSEQDGKDMLHTAHVWARTYSILVIVTLGEKGAVAVTKEETIKLPTVPVPHGEVVDSVGSGDIFSASFAYAYKKTMSIEKAGEYANKIARACLFYSADTIELAPSLLWLE